MKRLNTIINTIMGACIGVFIGHSVYIAYDFNKYPEIYAMQSAPWYSSILVYGLFTLSLLFICIVAKGVIKHKQKKAD